MLFLGVEFSPQTCSISAVSEHYTFLGHNYFEFNNKDQLEVWIRSMILNDCEDIKWFFCEKCYLSNDHHSFFLPSIASHTHYMVKDRVVKDIYHTICEINHASNHSIVDISLILAMSLRLFDSQFIYLYYSEQQSRSL